MTPKEFNVELCKAIANYFNNNFPCFCGFNKYGENTHMDKEDLEKAELILSLFDNSENH